MAPGEQHVRRKLEDRWLLRIERKAVAECMLQPPSLHAIRHNGLAEDRPNDLGEIREQPRKQRFYQIRVARLVSNNELFGERERNRERIAVAPPFRQYPVHHLFEVVWVPLEAMMLRTA